MQLRTEGSLLVGEKRVEEVKRSRPFVASQTWGLIPLAPLA